MPKANIIRRNEMRAAFGVFTLVWLFYIDGVLYKQRKKPSRHFFMCLQLICLLFVLAIFCFSHKIRLMRKIEYSFFSVQTWQMSNQHHITDAFHILCYSLRLLRFPSAFSILINNDGKKEFFLLFHFDLTVNFSWCLICFTGVFNSVIGLFFSSTSLMLTELVELLE